MTTAGILLRAVGCVVLLVAVTLRTHADDLEPGPRKWCVRLSWLLTAGAGALIFNGL